MNYTACKRCNGFYMDHGNGHSCKPFQVAEVEDHKDGEAWPCAEDLEYEEFYALDREEAAKNWAKKMNEGSWEHSLDEDGCIIAVFSEEDDEGASYFNVFAEPDIYYSTSEAKQ